jgi:hypothetical protein
MFLQPGQRIIHPIFGDCTKEVEEALNEQIAADFAQAERERLIIAGKHAGGVKAAADGSHISMRLPSAVATAWRMREGKDCWKDSGHLKYFKKHFPEFFPKVHTGRTVVSVPGGAK